MNLGLHKSNRRVASIETTSPIRAALVLLGQPCATNLAALSGCIRKDERLCARLLALASLDEGCRIARLEDAIVLLGARRLHQLLSATQSAAHPAKVLRRTTRLRLVAGAIRTWRTEQLQEEHP